MIRLHMCAYVCIYIPYLLRLVIHGLSPPPLPLLSRVSGRRTRSSHQTVGEPSPLALFAPLIHLH